jgi:hypothetical protein
VGRERRPRHPPFMFERGGEWAGAGAGGVGEAASSHLREKGSGRGVVVPKRWCGMKGGGEAASPPRGPTHIAFVRGRGPSSLIRLRPRLFVSRSGLGVC